jgi:hypothetical protein
MKQNYTSILGPQKRIRRFYAKPSEATLQIIKDFARTYIPDFPESSGPAVSCNESNNKEQKWSFRRDRILI